VAAAGTRLHGSAMAVDAHGIILLGFALQALAAIGLAWLLRRFHRLYQHGYQRMWSWSWIACSVYLVGSAAAVLAAPALPVGGGGRLVAAFVPLVAGCWQIVWLLAGAFELAEQRPVAPRTVRGFLVVSVVLSALAVGVGRLVAKSSEILLVFGLRGILAALAFFVAASVLARSPGASGTLGRRLMSVAFALFGLGQLHGAVSTWLASRNGWALVYTIYVGQLDFVLEALMGLGLVMWLLEDERQRAVVAGERIQTLAYQDPVTGLSNRTLFFDHLRRALARARRGEESVAVLFLDLDRFKAVNDTWGHGVGDQVLRAAGRRLLAELRDEDCLARFGGDEFAVLVPGIRHNGEVAALCRRLLAAASRPLTVSGHEIFTAVSIGASLFPAHGDDPELLVKRADIAMYEAKAQGRDRFEFYDAVLGARVQERSVESDLRRALKAGEFVLFYQPVVDLASGRTAGVEALLRWDHPQRGIVGPEVFLPVAEASGLVDRLDAFALRAAADQAVAWRAQGLPVPVAINMSAGQLHRFGMVHQVQEVLAATGLPAASLSIEITETAAMRDAGATQVVLNSLRDLGVGLAMDDFGTGYSSLSHLQSFPIDQLKIDVSFVRGLGRDPQSATITSAVIGLAHGLGLLVVGEGIETEQQMMMLRGFGCDRGQGYLFGRPVRAEEISATHLRVSDDRAQEGDVVAVPG
jgi:diguanylate cyclase (GGDEF)-like protein